MKLIKVKKVKKGIWHEVCGGLYDYHEKVKETHYIVELDEDEYISLVQKEKKDEKR